MKKKYAKTVYGMISAGAVTGIGSNVVTQTGGSSAGLGKLSEFYPMMGTVAGAGMAMDALKGLKPRRKKR